MQEKDQDVNREIKSILLQIQSIDQHRYRLWERRKVLVEKLRELEDDQYRDCTTDN